jgi:hypothetical protein
MAKAAPVKRFARLALRWIEENIRAVGTLLLASALLAYWVSIELRMGWFWLNLTAILCATSTICWLMMQRWLSRIARQNEQFQRRIDSLSYEDARSEAQRLLHEVSRFRITPRSSTIAVEDLPPCVAEIFGEFELIVDSTGNRLFLGSRTEGYLHVGDLHDGVKLQARISDGAIFEVWPDESGTHRAPDYPSIYHWIVINESQD